MVLTKHNSLLFNNKNCHMSYINMNFQIRAKYIFCLFVLKEFLNFLWCFIILFYKQLEM